ncbi:MAG: Crp/Fnr family transcriptional regulator [Cyanobacteria bacterium J06626_18]
MSSSTAALNSDRPFSVLQAFRRKDCLPLMAHRVWRIEQGIVRTLTWDEAGHVTTFGLWGRGDLVGQPLTQQMPYQIECLTPVVATDISLGHHSHYWQSALLNHLWHSEELFRIAHQPTVMRRLTQLLHWLAQRFGKPVPQGQLLSPILTHQQLAEILGTTRVTVTRLLTRLEAEGQLVKFKKSAGNWTHGIDLEYEKRALLLPHPQIVPNPLP